MTTAGQLVRWSRSALLYAAPLLLVLAAVRILSTVPVARLLPHPLEMGLEIALLYLLSHALRAARLALLSASAYGVSARTTGLLHLYTAPVSLMIPFKLGELYRLQQLASLTGTPFGAMLIVLLDRVLDVAVLLPAFVVFVLLGDLPNSQVIPAAAPLLVILIVGGVLSFAGPGALEALQRYIFLRHSRPRARRLLAVLVRLRAAVARCGNSLRTHLAPLLSLSLAIWVLEIAASWLFVRAYGLGAGLTPALYDVFGRIMIGWHTPLTLAASTEPLSPILGFAALLLIWPFVAIWYVRRLHKLWADTPRPKHRVVPLPNHRPPRLKHGVG